MNLVDVVNEDHKNKNLANLPDFRVGDTIAVNARITEGTKTRIQVFQGVCIAIKHKESISGHFRVRKVSNGGMGVERVFPYHSPNVDSVKVLQRGKTKRAKLYYLRERSGKSARISIDYERK